MYIEEMVQSRNTHFQGQDFLEGCLYLTNHAGQQQGQVESIRLIIDLALLLFMAGFSKAKYFRLAKGFYGRSKNCIKITIPRVEKALQKAYVGRKMRPRIMRRNWIMQISAVTRDLNLPYSRFINHLNNSNICLNRKILADLAAYQPYSFKAVFDELLVQGEALPAQRISLESIIRKNLVTATKLQEEMYKKQPEKGVRLRY